MCEESILNCFFMVYPVQAILVITGLILCISGVIIYSVRGNTKIDIWIFKNVPIPRLSRQFGIIFLSIGLVCILVGLIWLVIANRGRPLLDALTPTAQEEGIALIGVRYMADGWDPRLVDLRTAAEDGIPTTQGGSLQINSLWVSVPPKFSDSEVQIEIYANGDLIGLSSLQPLVPPVTQIDDIQIKGYQDSGIPDAWLIQADWETLDISAVVFHQGRSVGFSKTSIRLGSGMSWFKSPPNASIVSITYTVNGGIQKVMDMQQILTSGLNVAQNDRLDFQAISYSADADGAGQTLWVEAYLTPDGYLPATLKTNRDNSDFILKGIHELSSVSSLSWTVPANMNRLVMTLERSDRTVLDRINIPLNAQSDPGLVSVSESVLWPFEQVEYLDFEIQSDFNSWSGVEQNTVNPSNTKSFSGERSLSVTVVSDQTQVFVKRDQPFRAAVLVGQVYLPQEDGIDVQWMQVCVTPSFSCISIPTEPGQWNTFIADLSEIEFQGERSDRTQLSSFFIQGKVIGASSDQPYTFYVDGIQIYPATTP